MRWRMFLRMVFLIGVTAIVIAWIADLSARAKRGAVSGPMLHVPTEMDLGTIEAGKIATAILPLRNTGDAELRVDNIDADCTCSGVSARNSSGASHRVRTVVIPPGQTT